MSHRNTIIYLTNLKHTHPRFIIPGSNQQTLTTQSTHHDIILLVMKQCFNESDDILSNSAP